ncbi:Protein of unknown function [Pyronema omphalodes CBS 100304]|uniref:Uncharacterized protein n=1 Tax=Pyronema omphalodes (strain CBS 100304) TaxID=1076935 RepID=U4L5U7_PYROM|nr:Protein of unknown function [Pyronema omphalodes CBS 100304]
MINRESLERSPYLKRLFIPLSVL